MTPERLSEHYWEETDLAETLLRELRVIHGDDSKTGRAKRDTLAAELQAVEAHLLRQLGEATGLGLGCRLLND
jgi:hypothetical protein